jgi:hypothetical protein
MVMVTDHGLLTKGPSHTFTNNTFNAYSGGTCHIMLDMKPYVTDISFGNNETMASVSKGQYKGIVLQRDGTTVDIDIQDVLYIPKLMVNLFSLTKAIEHTGI